MVYAPGFVDRDPTTSKRMNFDSNINGTRIAYEYRFENELTEAEQELYEVATQEAENALAAIHHLQERRKGGEDAIEEHILYNGIDELRDEIGRLEEALTLIEAIAWATQPLDPKYKPRVSVAQAILNGGK